MERERYALYVRVFLTPGLEGAGLCADLGSQQVASRAAGARASVRVVIIISSTIIIMSISIIMSIISLMLISLSLWLITIIIIINIISSS